MQGRAIIDFNHLRLKFAMIPIVMVLVIINSLQNRLLLFVNQHPGISDELILPLIYFSHVFLDIIDDLLQDKVELSMLVVPIIVGGQYDNFLCQLVERQ